MSCATVSLFTNVTWPPTAIVTVDGFTPALVIVIVAKFGVVLVVVDVDVVEVDVEVVVGTVLVVVVDGDVFEPPPQDASINASTPTAAAAPVSMRPMRPTFSYARGGPPPLARPAVLEDPHPRAGRRRSLHDNQPLELLDFRLIVVVIAARLRGVQVR
jgi:hypothetical protein